MLLRRLRDEAQFQVVWGALSPAGAPMPHARAAGVLEELRSAGGSEAVAEAERGRLAPLLRRLTRPDPKTLTPKLAHHLALIAERNGAFCARSERAEIRAGAVRSHLRAISMWLWLADEGMYLASLAQQVIAGALSESDVEAAAHAAGFALLRTLGETARAGAADLTAESELAANALARVDEACEWAACSETLTSQATAIARSERDRAVGQAIARVETAIEEATVRGAAPDELVSLLWDATAVWRWAGHDVYVERFLARSLTSTLWDLYREKRWDNIRTLLAPLDGPIESLARRTESDRSQLAYAAPCAQMLIFQAEVCRKFDQQLAIAERALRICPTHRNARVVCADLLVERAMRRLDRAKPWATGDALTEAEVDVRRAMGLFPQLKRLEKAKRRFAAHGIVLDDNTTS